MEVNQGTILHFPLPIPGAYQIWLHSFLLPSNPFFRSFSWPPPANGMSYPTLQTQLPNWPVSSNDPPPSARSWTYGNYPPASSSTWGPPPSQAPAWGQTPNTSWGVQTPGGTWGAPSSAGSYGPPQTPHSPWLQQPQQPYLNISQGTPFDSAFGQPITAGWFGAGNEETMTMGGISREKKKPVGHHSSMRRSNSHGRPTRQRTVSLGVGADYQYPYYSEPFDAQNLARRPRDWRPDFDSRAGLASYIPRVGKARSDVEGWSFLYSTQ